jgi:hypothetical protein
MVYIFTLLSGLLNSIITSKTFNSYFNEAVTGLFTTLCDTMKPKPSNTLPFKCACNYTTEYVNELLWYKDYYINLNIFFIGTYIFVMLNAVYYAYTLLNFKQSKTVGTSTTNFENNFLSENMILRDLENFNFTGTKKLATIQEEPEFENIPLNEPLVQKEQTDDIFDFDEDHINKKRKITDDYIEVTI